LKFFRQVDGIQKSWRPNGIGIDVFIIALESCLGYES
jgi:hypothetical protein